MIDPLTDMPTYDCENCTNNTSSRMIPRKSIENGTMEAVEGNYCTFGYWWFHPEDYADTPQSGECGFFKPKEVISGE